MSTVTHPEPPHGPQEPEDPFRYGWRYVKTVDPDGTERLKQIPLTLEDVHHPQEEDFIMQRGGHADDCIYLRSVLKTRLGAAALVTFDLRMTWQTPLVDALGPDVGVIFGAVDRDRGTFDCAAEGLRPTVVFEVTSPSTRVNDVGPKVTEYYLAGVDWYVIIDALAFRNGRWVLQVLGYRRGDGGYVPVALDDRDWLWVEPLRIYVAVREGRVVCFDAKGNELLDHAQTEADRQLEKQQRQDAEQQRDDERRQREDERQQREKAEQAQQLSDQARVLAEQQRDDERQQREKAEKAQLLSDQAKVLAEQQREDERQQREKAEQAQQLSDQARVLAEQQRDDMAERLRQMENELRRLRGE